MTGSALALKLVISHEQDKLQNMEHGLLRDALVKVSGTQILFRSIWLKKFVYKYV